MLMDYCPNLLQLKAGIDTEVSFPPFLFFGNNMSEITSRFPLRAESSFKWRQELPRPSYTREEVQKHKQELRAYKDSIRTGSWKLIPYNEFLTLVKERPDPSLSHKPTKCPLCDSSRINLISSSSTLVGGAGSWDDPNHHESKYHCNGCDKGFTVEYTGLFEASKAAGTVVYNVWYTKNGKVLKGIPSCFEPYIYTCSSCEGEVKRHYFKKGTRQDVGHSLYYVDGKPDFESYFICSCCNKEVKSSTEYWVEESPHYPRKPYNSKRPPRLRLGWRICEEVGMCVINDIALTLINLPEKIDNES